MLWGSVGWFPVHWGGIRFGWRTSEMVRFILDISPHDYILSASIQKCLLIDFHHSPIREALQKPVITTSLFISGVWAYDLETIRRRSWTGRAAGVFFKQKVWSKMSLANFWFFSFFFCCGFSHQKGKSLLASGKKLLIVLRLFGSKRKSLHIHIFALCKLDILISSLWFFCDRQ